MSDKKINPILGITFIILGALFVVIGTITLLQAPEINQELRSMANRKFQIKALNDSFNRCSQFCEAQLKYCANQEENNECFIGNDCLINCINQ